MKTIWKFPLIIADSQTILLSKGAKVLSVQTQGEMPCLWAMVDPSLPMGEVEIRTHGTGHPLPEDAHLYANIGTYQLKGGALIFHVFRVMSAGEAILKSGIL